MGKFSVDKSSSRKFGGVRSGSGIQKRSFHGGSGGGNRNSSRKSKFMSNEEDLVAPNWDDYELKPFKKDFYVPHDNILKR